jgi:hypothetical protein
MAMSAEGFKFYIEYGSEKDAVARRNPKGVIVVTGPMRWSTQAMYVCEAVVNLMDSPDSPTCFADYPKRKLNRLCRATTEVEACALNTHLRQKLTYIRKNAKRQTH